MPTDLLAESMNDEIMTRLLFQLGLRSSARTPGPVAYVNFQFRVHHGRVPPGWVREVITLWKAGVLQIRPGRSLGVLLH